MAAEVQSYVTAGGITVRRQVVELSVPDALEPLLGALDLERGLLLASSYDYPGRYTRWDVGFVNPPLVLEATERSFAVTALNGRGQRLLPAIARTLSGQPAVMGLESKSNTVSGTVAMPTGRFAEEHRSQQPSLFSVLRALRELFASKEEPHLGLYGAFGYDLAFQFEPVQRKLERAADQRDLVLYLPDSLVVVDHRRERAARYEYDFTVDGVSTRGLPRTGSTLPPTPAKEPGRPSDHQPGEYAQLVNTAKESFVRGDLFEVVPGQVFYEPCAAPPSELFRRLKERNPAPFGFLMNLGLGEYLVGASPEMFVRVDGDRIETCPISGTIARGADAMADATQILTLLNSGKDESELTMCTDVDRNDKYRICEPGSVKILGRRQIEMYSRLIHTVDHVEGKLREGFDALDGFLAHAWAVTVTGAPKAWAMQFIEDHERSPRVWYGGAVGLLGFDGRMNTGLTLRTIRVKDGVAEVRVGATLLFDSDPEEEERETHTKASALLDAIRRPRDTGATPTPARKKKGAGRRVVVVDHQDSFVHTLAGYFRATGAEVVTWRAGFPLTSLDDFRADLVVLSPGPGTPRDFNVSATVTACLERNLPLFGVCLGLQGIVEHFGGVLGVLGYPMHGKPSVIQVLGGRLFEGIPETFRAGRYHSLYALRPQLPGCLKITAESDDGVVMALEHETLPIFAVQFHPESIMSLENEVGLRLIENVVQGHALG